MTNPNKPRITINSQPATVVKLDTRRILVTPATESVNLMTVAEQGPPGPAGERGEKGKDGGLSPGDVINGGYF